jgi:hypothetical protein
LTPSTHGYDTIFVCVCVDKLSKMGQFMPTMTHVIANGMARLFNFVIIYINIIVYPKYF